MTPLQSLLINIVYNTKKSNLCPICNNILNITKNPNFFEDDHFNILYSSNNQKNNHSIAFVINNIELINYPFDVDEYFIFYTNKNNIFYNAPTNINSTTLLLNYLNKLITFS